MKTNGKLHLATVAGVILFVGVGQWLLNPDVALAAIACATISIVPGVAHWLVAARVSRLLLQAALLWGPLLIFGVLWIWGQSLPDNEGQNEIADFLIAYTCVPWCCTSLILLRDGRTSRAINNQPTYPDSIDEAVPMKLLSAEWEYLSFFEVKPHLTDPDIGWYYNHLTFDVARDSDRLFFEIQPSSGLLVVLWMSCDNPVLDLRLCNVESLQVVERDGHEWLIAQTKNDPAERIRMTIKPEVFVQFQNRFSHEADFD